MEVSDQLANLGAMIAGGIEKNVQQNQFQAALPGMQEAFKSAMTDFDSGRSGAGFSKIMAVAMQNPNNPYIQNVTQMAFKAGQFASDDYFKGQQIDVARAKATGSGVELTQDEIDEFENFGNKSRSVVTPASTTTTTTGIPATRIGPDGIATVPNVNAEGLPTRTGNEPPQVSLTEPVDFTTPVTEMQGVGDLKPNQQLVDTSYLLELDIPIAAVIGPEAFNVEEPQGTTESMKLTRKGTSRDKSVSTKTVLKNTAEKADFEEKVQASRKAASAVKNNLQLKKIFESSGRNFDNISLDEEQGYDGKIIYSAEFMDSKGVTTKERLSESEYNHLDVLKGIRDYIQASGGRIKVIAPKSAPKTELFPIKETTQKSQPQPGLPAVQAGPVAPQIPEEAAQLQQIVQQGKAAKAGERAKSTANEIAKIDAEIKQLSAPSRQAGATPMRGMFPSSGATSKSEKQKSPEQAQADIQRIMQLKARKDQLQAELSNVTK